MILSKPLMIAAGVLLVAVMGLSTALWWSISANGGLEARNEQLVEDAKQREEHIEKLAKLNKEREVALSERDERLAKLDEDLTNAQNQLESMERLGGAISGDFAEWLQRAGDDADANSGRDDTKPPIAAPGGS